MSVDIIRSRTIAVSHRTYWSLRMLAKGLQRTVGGLEKPEMADGIADKILREHLDAHYPMLGELYKRKQTVDDEAVESVNKKDQ